jgi:hypothetical protein
VELAVVLVAASLCCAQAPKVKALANTATIMIALTNFNVYRLLSLQLLRLFRQGNESTQRFFRFFSPGQNKRLVDNTHGRALLDEVK